MMWREAIHLHISSLWVQVFCQPLQRLFSLASGAQEQCTSSHSVVISESFLSMIARRCPRSGFVKFDDRDHKAPNLSTAEALSKRTHAIK
jgi:hypothetical protein